MVYNFINLIVTYTFFSFTDIRFNDNFYLCSYLPCYSSIWCPVFRVFSHCIQKANIICTLYVYQSVYESGGEMFPVCLQLTLFALVLGQLTFIGYLGTRKAFSQVLFLLPLPLATLWGKNYFNEYYVSKCAE